MAEKRRFEDMERESLSSSTPFVSAFAATKGTYSVPLASSSSSSSPDNTDTEEDTQTQNLQLQLQSQNQYDPSGEYDSDVDDSTHYEFYHDRRPNQQNELLKDRQLCNVDNPSTYVKASTASELVIELKSGQSICLIGQYSLHVISGEIWINGARIRASAALYDVYAPSTHSLPVIKCVSQEPAHLEFWHVAQTMRPLRYLSPLFDRLWNLRTKDDIQSVAKYPATHDRRSFSVLKTSTDDPLKRYLFPLSAHPTWTTAIKEISNKLDHLPITFVCGHKAVGKSTFCRLLANDILTTATTRPATIPGMQKWSTAANVYWLDLDQELPEYTPPGQVSLVKITQVNLGVPYTHSQGDHRMIRAHHTGFHDTTDHVVHYMKSVIDLFETYCNLNVDDKGPLMINCPSFVEHRDQNMLRSLIHILKPDFAISFNGAFRSIIESSVQEESKVLCQLQGQPSVASSRTDEDLRAMQTMSYFHQIRRSDGRHAWSSQRLSRMRPWVVNYGSDQPDFLAFLFLGDEIAPSVLHIILEGCPVAIVVIEDFTAFSGHQARRASSDALMQYTEKSEQEINPSIMHTKNHGFPYLPHSPQGVGIPLDPAKSRCIGLGLIRSIDYAKQELHILTPLADEVCQNFNPSNIVLVRGRLDTPEWSYAEDYYWHEHLKSRNTNPIPTGPLSAEVFGGVYDHVPDPFSRPRLPWVSYIDDQETTRFSFIEANGLQELPNDTRIQRRASGSSGKRNGFKGSTPKPAE